MGVNLGYMSMINIFDAGEPLLEFTNITCWGQFDVLACLFFVTPFWLRMLCMVAGSGMCLLYGLGDLFCNFQVRMNFFMLFCKNL